MVDWERVTLRLARILPRSRFAKVGPQTQLLSTIFYSRETPVTERGRDESDNLRRMAPEGAWAGQLPLIGSCGIQVHPGAGAEVESSYRGGCRINALRHLW